MLPVTLLLCASLGANIDDAVDPLDLGHVRYYFTSGVVLSNSGRFAQAGLFLGLNVDRSWLVTNRPGWRRVGINTYFETQLTSVALQPPITALSFILAPW